MDFKVLNTGSKAVLFADSIGSDAMRWFMYWESDQTLWVYASDYGYFKVIEFASGESATAREVASGAGVPQVVWDHLPGYQQRQHASAP